MRVTYQSKLTNMTCVAVLPHRPLSQAKAQLSDVMSDVVHRGQTVVVDRHRGKESMVLLGMETIRPLLANFRFATETRFEDGEWTLFSPELNLLSASETFDEALDELVSLAEQYATDFFDRRDFYVHTDRAGHEPWLMRVAVADEEARRLMFIEPPTAIRTPRPA